MRSGSGCCCRGARLAAAFEPALERLLAAVDFLAVEFLAVPAEAPCLVALCFEASAEDWGGEPAVLLVLLPVDFFLAEVESVEPCPAFAESACQAKRNASDGIRTRPRDRRGGCTNASLSNGRSESLARSTTSQ